MVRYFPLLDIIANYNKTWLSKDLIAGLTVGIMLIPQGMAYAVLAGLPPIYGLYAATVPLIIYALLGTSRQLAVGPVAMISLLVSSGVGALAVEGSSEYIALAILLALMVGIVQVGMGILRMGNIIKFLPHSMISGFTTGAALIIISSQLNSLFGLNISRGNFIETAYNISTNLQDLNLLTTLIALGSILSLLVSRKWFSRFPTPLFLIISSILLISHFDLELYGVDVIGDIPSGLPSFSIMEFDTSHVMALLPIALIISIIGYMESVAVAKTIEAKRKNYKINNNSELMALGMANIIGSFFQSYPTTGGFSRTAVNDEAGAESGIASIVSALLVIVTLMLLTSYFYYLPMAVLAAIIVVAVSGLIDINEAKHLYQNSKSGFLIFFMTALSTIMINVEAGLSIGIIISFVVQVIKKMKISSTVTNVTQESKSKAEIRIMNSIKSNKVSVEQIYTGCLAQGAYYIQSNGEAAIIDPLREVSPYLKKAEDDKVKIKYIFETHFHADFVSGHLTLAEKTGAPIIYGPNANPEFDAHIASDGETFTLGDVTIKVLHTPGHTMESTTYLLLDENGKEAAIFTGDTLFLGDVGRPDLSQKSSDLTTEDLASHAYDSLRNKIMSLPDDILVYPAHGAGSACGKNMMKETVDTLGNQKKMNYALRPDMTKDEFIKEVTQGLGKPPAYFPLNVKLNKEGYEHIDKIYNTGLKQLNPKEFEFIAEEMGAIILDVRSPLEFSNAYIPKSIFIGLDGSFAPWVGELIVDVHQPIIFIAPVGREKETVTRLARVGFDNTLGYLEGGIDSWKQAGKELDRVRNANASAIGQNQISKGKPIIDVRKSLEFQSEHVVDANNIPLSEINTHLASFPKEEDFLIHCAGGYRSMIAASILKSRGYHNLINIEGGFKAIKGSDARVTDYVCPTSL